MKRFQPKRGGKGLSMGVLSVENPLVPPNHMGEDPLVPPNHMIVSFPADNTTAGGILNVAANDDTADNTTAGGILNVAANDDTADNTTAGGILNVAANDDTADVNVNAGNTLNVALNDDTADVNVNAGNTLNVALNDDTADVNVNAGNTLNVALNDDIAASGNIDPTSVHGQAWSAQDESDLTDLMEAHQYNTTDVLKVIGPAMFPGRTIQAIRNRMNIIKQRNNPMNVKLGKTVDVHELPDYKWMPEEHTIINQAINEFGYDSRRIVYDLQIKGLLPNRDPMSIDSKVKRLKDKKDKAERKKLEKENKKCNANMKKVVADAVEAGVSKAMANAFEGPVFKSAVQTIVHQELGNFAETMKTMMEEYQTATVSKIEELLKGKND